MSGALLVAGTGSDAGKSLLTAGLCRYLQRQGVRVAPFKAQNMSLNSWVTADGSEIGRAQAMQAAAAKVPAEGAMNPVLLKPGDDRRSQLVVRGRPVGEVDAGSYPAHKAALLEIVLADLADLRSRFDVVICEGAGSPAEINLRDHDLANMGLARRAGLPVLLVGDIDRGGVFASLFGTVALLDPADQALIAGFVINKFRGDPAVLAPGLSMLETLTGRPVHGVLPWRPGLQLDAEDSLDLEATEPEDVPEAGPGSLDGHDLLRVAVIRLPRLSNSTDADPLACEPGVRVRLVTSPRELDDADLVILPGSRATVADLAWLRQRGLAGALVARAARGGPILALCAGYQMAGTHIHDPVESGAGEVPGLGLLPVRTAFATTKTLRRPTGSCPPLGGVPAAGYEIHHGRTRAHGGAPMFRTDGGPEGCHLGSVWGTSWHGIFEDEGLRHAFLRGVAQATGKRFRPGTRTFSQLREARLDALGDLVAAHLDTTALHRLLESGAPPGLPFLPPGAPAPILVEVR